MTDRATTPAGPMSPIDERLAGDADEVVHPIQPYQARKAYVCPGCTTEIPVGVGHLVVVPAATPDLRRHWHRGCWHKERRRRGDALDAAADVGASPDTDQPTHG